VTVDDSGTVGELHDVACESLKEISVEEKKRQLTDTRQVARCLQKGSKIEIGVGAQSMEMADAGIYHSHWKRPPPTTSLCLTPGSQAPLG
jgi:PHP family Zn ribbon phosphoesterase